MSGELLTQAELLALPLEALAGGLARTGAGDTTSGTNTLLLAILAELREAREARTTAVVGVISMDEARAEWAALKRPASPPAQGGEA